MEKDLVTVVVPVYKTEKYLDRCVTSVVNQTHRKLEIILVDDGSPDNCPKMCDDWAKKDNRIKVVHKENAGLGMARNTGIENAHGEYICFLDSDDYLETDIIKNAIGMANKTAAEIVCFWLAGADKEGNIIQRLVPQVAKSLFVGQEVRDILLPDIINGNSKNAKIKSLQASVCTNLFKMELIKRAGWRLVSERDIISEDTYSILDLYRNVQSVAVLAEAGYIYCCNDSSLTRTYRKDRFERIKRFYCSALRLWEVANYSEEVKDRVSRLFLGFTVGALKQIATAEEKFGEKMESIRSIICDDMLQLVLRSIDLCGFNVKLRVFFQLIKHKQRFAVYALSRLQAAVTK